MIVSPSNLTQSPPVSPENTLTYIQAEEIKNNKNYQQFPVVPVYWRPQFAVAE